MITPKNWVSMVNKVNKVNKQGLAYDFSVYLCT